MTDRCWPGFQRAEILSFAARLIAEDWLRPPSRRGSPDKLEQLLSGPFPSCQDDAFDVMGQAAASWLVRHSSMPEATTCTGSNTGQWGGFPGSTRRRRGGVPCRRSWRDLRRERLVGQRLQRQQLDRHHLDRVDVVGAPVVQRGLVGPAVVGRRWSGETWTWRRWSGDGWSGNTWSSAGWNWPLRDGTAAGRRNIPPPCAFPG
jgi:hypothetical protein